MSDPTLSDIYYKLGSLESKIDSTLQSQQHYNSRYEERLDDHDNRITNLERLEAKRTGMIVILAGFFSIISGVVIKYISTLIPSG